MEWVEFVAVMNPSPQPRVGSSPMGHRYSLPKGHPTARYRQRVKALARQAMADAGYEPWHGPIGIMIEYYRHRPKRLMRKKDPEHAVWAPTRPDVDNYNKATFDALNGVVWVDDGQIVEEHVYKRYHAKSTKPRICIRIWCIQE